MSRRRPATSCSTPRPARASAPMSAPSPIGCTSLRFARTDVTWSRVVIWSSGIGTHRGHPRRHHRRLDVFAARSATDTPERRAASRIAGRSAGTRCSGLVFGVATVTWAFSGMLSMDPFPSRETGGGGSTRRRPAVDSRRPSRHSPVEVLRGVRDEGSARGAGAARDLSRSRSWSSRRSPASRSTWPRWRLATPASIPCAANRFTAFDHQRIIDVVERGSRSRRGRDQRADAVRPLLPRSPAHSGPCRSSWRRLNDAAHTRYYIDPNTARVVGSYDSSAWVNRWLYNGLHSLNFPWLYNYRPLWDIVVITFMVGGTALCVTSLILAWRVLGGSCAVTCPEHHATRISDDLAMVD